MVFFRIPDITFIRQPEKNGRFLPCVGACRNLLRQNNPIGKTGPFRRPTRDKPNIGEMSRQAALDAKRRSDSSLILEDFLDFPVCRRIDRIALVHIVIRDISMEEVTRIIGEKIGKPDLKYVHFPREEYINGLLQAGLTKDMAEQLAELDAGINDRLFASGEPRTQDNRTRTDFEQFADFFAKVYKS